MLGELAPTAGKVEIGSRTQINYVDENRLLLDESRTVYDEVGEGLEYVRLGDENITLRGYLRRFLFTDERINTRIEQLSGGERSRVILAKVLKRGGNVIILDEPTNDLDLATLRLLEEALLIFQGSIIVVSHDRYFLNRICTHTLAFEGDAKVTLTAGNYDYYLEKRAARTASIAPQPIAAKSPPRAAKVRKLSYKEQRELETIEADIEAAEQQVTRLEEQLAELTSSGTNPHEWPALEAQLEHAKSRVTQLLHRWEELESIRAALL